MLIEFLLIISSLILFYVLYENKNGKNQPPGPTKWPFFGNLLQLMKIHPEQTFVAFHKLSLIYGPIMSIKLGWRDAIVLCGYNEMKDLLTREECSARIHDSYLFDRSDGKEKGVIFTNGKNWERVRKVTVRALRDFGFGKAQTMESFLEQEALHLVKNTINIGKQNNGVVEINERYFHMGVLNTLWSMLAGHRHEWDDPKLQEILDINDRAFDVGSFGANLSFSFPALRFIFPETFAYHLQKKLYSDLREFMRKIYQDRKKCEEYKTSPDNACDVFLQEAEKEMNTPNPVFDEDQYVMTALDLFQAGGETTAAALGYSLMMMITHPKIQSRIHEEIDSICPKGTAPCLSHQNQHLHGNVKNYNQSMDIIRMPYTQATLLEVMRFCHIVPLVPPRKFAADVHYKGYHFKKDTALMVNIYSVSMDKAYWKDPEVFRPERFINSDGKFVADEHVAVFGFGKRMCLGDVLAKANTFIFFITMMQNFNFERVKGEPLPSTEPICGFTMRPKPFNVQIKERT